jgi:hypothetical protein
MAGWGGAFLLTRLVKITFIFLFYKKYFPVGTGRGGGDFGGG